MIIAILGDKAGDDNNDDEEFFKYGILFAVCVLWFSETFSSYASRSQLKLFYLQTIPKTVEN